jgi:hypothetical protein
VIEEALRDLRLINNIYPVHRSASIRFFLAL